MDYGLKRMVLGSTDFIELPKHEAEQLFSDKAHCLLGYILESKFDTVMQNYFEFEKCNLEISANRMIFGGHGYRELQQQRMLLSRRFVNAVSSCRTYLDQIDHETSAESPLPADTSTKISKTRNEQYDRLLGYRAMEAIRNWAIHRGDPITAMNGGYTRVETQHAITGTAGVLSAFCVYPEIDVDELKRRGGFKKSVLEELEEVAPPDRPGDPPGRIDARVLLREYIDGLNEVHKCLREICSDGLKESEIRIQGAIKRFEQAYPNNWPICH